jgi:hypothetical protein
MDKSKMTRLLDALDKEGFQVLLVKEEYRNLRVEDPGDKSRSRNCLQKTGTVILKIAPADADYPLR